MMQGKEKRHLLFIFVFLSHLVKAQATSLSYNDLIVTIVSISGKPRIPIASKHLSVTLGRFFQESMFLIKPSKLSVRRCQVFFQPPCSFYGPLNPKTSRATKVAFSFMKSGKEPFGVVCF